MKTVLVKSAQTENKTDKNGRIYRTCTFVKENLTEIRKPGSNIMQVVVGQPIETSINLYEKSYLNDKAEFGFSDKLGTLFEGDIVTRTVEPYEITDSSGNTRTVNTYKTVVFGDTSTPESFEIAVARTFKAKGHPVVTSVAMASSSPQPVVLETATEE